MGDECVVFVVPVNERVTNEKISKYFSSSGRVTRIDRYHNGTCFVSFAAPEEAQHAIQTLHRTLFSGRFITVEEKRVKTGRSLHYESDWTLFAESVFICTDFNIYECLNAIPGGTCLKGRHCCFYCVACENGFLPHRNVDLDCPSRKAGFKDLERFKSKRHRLLAEQSGEGSPSSLSQQSGEGSRSTLSQQTSIQNTSIQREGGGYSTSSQPAAPPVATDSRPQTFPAARGIRPPTSAATSSRHPSFSAATGSRPRAPLAAISSRPPAPLAAKSSRPPAPLAAKSSRPPAPLAAKSSQSTAPLAAKSNRPPAPLADNSSRSQSLSPTVAMANKYDALQRVVNGSMAASASLTRNHLPRQSLAGGTVTNVSFKLVDMEGGEWHNVVISSCNKGPTDFAIQLAATTKQLDSLMTEIGRPNKLVLLDKNEITSGRSCLAAAMMDNNIYRAAVLKVNNNVASVLLVDIGIIENLEFNRIFQIDERHMQLPIFSFRCHLSKWPDLPPPSKALAKKRFELYKNRTLKCKFIPNTEGHSSNYFTTKEVKLIDDEGFVVSEEIKQWISNKLGEAGDGDQLSLHPSRAAQKPPNILLKEKYKNVCPSFNRSKSRFSSAEGSTLRENILRERSNIPDFVAPQKCSSLLNGKSGDSVSGGVKPFSFPASQYNNYFPRVFPQSGMGGQQGWSATASNSFAGNLGSNARLARKTLEFKVPREKIGLIMGHLSTRINKIRKESGARISIVESPENSDESLITVEGSAMAVEAAQSMLNAALKNN